jgi:phosphohistidine swiveling domain-containing protein
MLHLDECVDRPEAGAKAVRLAQARAAGLHVLDGVVLLPGDPPEIEGLGERLIVRSSSALEDAAGASAAGVFESIADVPKARLVAAVARVRASAEAEPARVYLSARGLEAAPLAVLIQPMSTAPRLAVAMSTGEGFLVEERRAGEPEWGDVVARRVESGPLAETLRKLERLVGGPVDAELALGYGDITITILQVRPRTRGPLEEVDAAFARFAEPGRWKLDAEHNPQPLSAAQAGLVELVEALQVGPRQRVVAGWLFVEVGGAPRGLHPLPLADLRRRFDEDVLPDCRARLAAADGLEPALAAYAHVYRRYTGEVAPSLSRARAQLDQLLRMNLGEPLSRHGDLLAGVGGAPLRRDQALWERPLPEYLAEFGAWSPVWDVAMPTDEEAPERLVKPPVEPMARHRAAETGAEEAARAVLDRLDRMARRAFKALLPTVRAAMEVGEDDDALFFEAQRTVRRALLALQVDGVFDMPLESVRRGVYDLKRDLKSALFSPADPPLWIEDGRPLRPIPPAREVLRGHATAGRARGRAGETILVLPALLPSLAPRLLHCRALVTEHGGATSHGATLAREYGVPAVLGARGATRIPDGAELYVDGEGGRVYLL